MRHFLANHGVAAWGVTLDEAMMVAGIVEKAAQLYCITQSLGGAVLLPQSDIDAMHGFLRSPLPQTSVRRRIMAKTLIKNAEIITAKDTDKYYIGIFGRHHSGNIQRSAARI